jgi:hypothetical protein
MMSEERPAKEDEMPVQSAMVEEMPEQDRHLKARFERKAGKYDVPNEVPGPAATKYAEPSSRNPNEHALCACPEGSERIYNLVLR